MNGLFEAFLRFLRSRGANVAPMAAILIVPIIGSLGLAGEVSTWYTVNRALQHAADSAAIAAAVNADATTDSTGVVRYKQEAIAVAKSMGFVNGSGATVNVTASSSACPASVSGTCYKVDISKTLPFYLIRIGGFGSGSSGQMITATAIAAGGSATDTPLCVVALGGTVNTGITANGGPKTDLSGCSIGSNGDETCNGHDLNADAGYAVYADSGCGAVQHSYVSPISDTLDANRASNIPANTCGSYPQGTSTSSLPTKNQLSGSPFSAGTTNVLCGDQLMTGDLTLGANTTLVIENGQFNTNGHTLNATAGATIIFTGDTSNTTYLHIPTGGGTLNLTAPTSGNWSGVAIYQDPNLPAGPGVDFAAAGNSPTWNIVGLLYLPKSNVTIKGAVNKNSNGACIGLVINTLTIDGTGYILDHNGCANAGVTLPSVSGGRVALVT